MYPTLIDFGPLAVHTYGLFVAMAFLAAIWWASREARLAGLDAEIVPDVALLILISAVVGARLLWVLLDLPHYLEHPLEALMFWKGGLVFSGGLVLAVLLGWWAMRRKRQPILRWCDASAPAIALGQAIGRLGCLGAGCCYGRPADLPWSVTFRSPQALAPLDIPLHPTQLYHSLASLLCFALLVAARGRLPRAGQRMGLYLTVFPLLRFIIEFDRDDYRGFAGPFSVTQIMAMAFFCVGVWLLARNPKGEKA
ncbi:prolipoprotein diacylglyceryl transferase [Paucidesulfovibrio longus]|uniref:prolipoprotein diacylglyceryl transferase n=1 Tax=Paucidesulfovibrio longus TaxID=889 RepID=UPI0003B5117B|nr:prolipoprotein diacylglyceryl transferase [Paucidesulfovibrio longus]